VTAPPAAQSQLRGTRSVLFVCLGNICRSPLAQGVFEHLLESRGLREDFTVESCGTGGWHVGSPPDERMLATARRHGVHLRSRARQLDPATDFQRFSLILPMDRRNLRDLRGHGCPPEAARLFLSFAPPAIAEPHALEVPDPYYGGPEGFDEVYRLVRAGAEGLLNAVL
jgi:protein-tyrosine phosphatase